MTADIVVLATTHPAPGVPSVLEQALANDPRLIPDATVKDALRRIEPSARIVIVGTGLTMADVGRFARRPRPPRIALRLFGVAAFSRAVMRVGPI